MAARVRYRKAWEREFPRTPGGRAAFLRKAGQIADQTADNLKAGGLASDPPAREYLAGLDTASTDTGAKVLTTGPRAHFVEFGTVHRAPEAPMRTAAARFGRLRG